MITIDLYRFTNIKFHPDIRIIYPFIEIFNEKIRLYKRTYVPAKFPKKHNVVMVYK